MEGHIVSYILTLTQAITHKLNGTQRGIKVITRREYGEADRRLPPVERNANLIFNSQI